MGQRWRQQQRRQQLSLWESFLLPDRFTSTIFQIIFCMQFSTHCHKSAHKMYYYSKQTNINEPNPSWGNNEFLMWVFQYRPHQETWRQFTHEKVNIVQFQQELCWCIFTLLKQGEKNDGVARLPRRQPTTAYREESRDYFSYWAVVDGWRQCPSSLSRNKNLFRIASTNFVDGADKRRVMVAPWWNKNKFEYYHWWCLLITLIKLLYNA